MKNKTNKQTNKQLFLPVEEKRGHTGSYGKQILYKTLAQVSVSHVNISEVKLHLKTGQLKPWLRSQPHAF